MTVRLRAAIGNYPHTAALKDGRVKSGRLVLDFADIPTINRAFAPMVRELAFDVSELAIATFFQAKACGKPIVLLPVVLAARYQEGALLCRADSDIAGPADLAGRRIGVRAYSQTTGMWIRGILSEQFGLSPDRMEWITFEDAHVAEIVDPPWARCAPAGADMMAMLRAGEVDAVIVGNDAPDDLGLRTVFADPVQAAAQFRQLHHVMPVNHILTVTTDLARREPELVGEIQRMFAESYRLGAATTLPPTDPSEIRRSVALALAYTAQQSMLPQTLTEDEIWDGAPATAERDRT